MGVWGHQPSSSCPALPHFSGNYKQPPGYGSKGNDDQPQISRLTYTHRCIEGAAVPAYRDNKIEIAPGMKIQYVVTDAQRYKVEPSWCAASFDVGYYRELVDKAYAEIKFAFSQAG